MSVEERKAILDRTLQRFGARGWRIENRSDFQAQIAKGQQPNHWMHLAITILTGGLWGFVWLYIGILSGIRRRMILIDEDGHVTENKL